MDAYKTLAFAAIGAVIIGVVWFGKLPAVRRARTAVAGRPNMIWWVTFGAAVLVTAFVANQLPDAI
jgi:hypothetical protein